MRGTTWPHPATAGWGLTRHEHSLCSLVLLIPGYLDYRCLKKMYTAGFVTPACARECYWRFNHSSSRTVGPSASVSSGPRALNPGNYLTLLVNTCFRAYRGTGLVSTHGGK